MTKNSLLIIDSTQPTLRMALWQDSTVLTKTGKSPYDASAHFFTYLDDLLQKDTTLNAVIGLTGPGSFTSLRTGLSALHGIALAKNIPAIGISSFEAYAKSKKFTEKTLILIESQREDHYAQFCDASGLIGQPFSCALEDAQKENAVGSAVDPEDTPDLEKVGIYAAEILAEGRADDYPLMPLYGINAHTT